MKMDFIDIVLVYSKKDEVIKLIKSVPLIAVTGNTGFFLKIEGMNYAFPPLNFVWNEEENKFYAGIGNIDDAIDCDAPDEEPTVTVLDE